MQQGLFRQEAIEHRKQGLHRDALLLPRLSHTLILNALVLWVLAVFIWLFASHYARKETVTGWLEPPEGIIWIYAEASGIAEKVLVSEGKPVAKNQPLLVIRDERTLASGDNLNGDLLRKYNSQQAILNEQLACVEDFPYPVMCSSSVRHRKINK